MFFNILLVIVGLIIFYFSITVVRIYKIPNTYIVGFVGEFGTGKSLLLVRHGLECANFYKKAISTNMDLDVGACRRYCKKFKLDWFAKHGHIRIIKSPDKLLSQENSIIIFDELAIDLFSRGFAEKSRKSLIDRIVRPRHYKNIIFYGAQGKEQIDLQMRERTQLFCWSKAFAPHNSKERRSELVARQSFYLSKRAFEIFNDEFGQSKWFYPYWASGFKVEIGYLTRREKMLFRCYNSFDRREKKLGKKLEYVDGNLINCSSASGKAKLSGTYDLSKLFGSGE